MLYKNNMTRLLYIHHYSRYEQHTRYIPTMTPRSSHLSGLLLAASLLSTSSTAQNTTNSTDYDRCDPDRPYNLDTINGTGTANVSDLYLHVAFRERRNPNDTGAQSLPFDPHTTLYLSAPEDSQKQACVYMFESLNGNRQGGGDNGCEGVLTKSCTDLIEGKYIFSEPQQQVPGGYACPTDMNKFRLEINKACGEALLLGRSVSNGTFALNPPTTLFPCLPMDSR
jgi:hypothetical protein